MDELTVRVLNKFEVTATAIPQNFLSLENIVTIKRDPLGLVDRVFTYFEITLSRSRPTIATEIITNKISLPLPLLARGIQKDGDFFVTDVCTYNAEECDGQRPDTGMLYPRG